MIKKGQESPNFKNRLGNQKLSNQGYRMTIIEYRGALNCTIEFEGGVVINRVTYQSFEKGEVKNPFHKTVRGVGYMGQGIYKSRENKKFTRCFVTWMGMITRGYCPKYQERIPTYKGITVCEDWHNFQNFGKWFDNNYNPEIMEDWQLDKDIICPNCKIYSPETCCFIPCEINSAFSQVNKHRSMLIGVTKRCSNYTASINIKGIVTHIGNFSTELEAFQAYKELRENHIKQIAEKWKGKILDSVYQILSNYKLEIDD